MVEILKVAQAKARLSELLAKAERGEEVLIARGDQPVVRLVALKARAKQRKPGRLAHWGEVEDRALLESDPEQAFVDAGGMSDDLGIWAGAPDRQREDDGEQRS